MGEQSHIGNLALNILQSSLLFFPFFSHCSVPKPFKCDYVQLKNNAKFKAKFGKSPDRDFAFADVVTKIDRKNGKSREVLFMISPSSVVLLDQKTIEVKCQVPLSDIKSITCSPYSDYFFILHVKKVSYRVLAWNRELNQVLNRSDVFFSINSVTC